GGQVDQAPRRGGEVPDVGAVVGRVHGQLVGHGVGARPDEDHVTVEPGRQGAVGAPGARLQLDAVGERDDHTAGADRGGRGGQQRAPPLAGQHLAGGLVEDAPGPVAGRPGGVEVEVVDGLALERLDRVPPGARDGPDHGPVVVVVVDVVVVDVEVV